MGDGAVWLSLPVESDIDAITAYCRHSTIAEWTTVPVPYVRTDAQKFVVDVVPAGWSARTPTWAIRRRENAPLIGMVSLHEIDTGAAEIGFWLAPKQRGQGLMSTAVRLVCAYAFAPEGMGLVRVEWRGFVGNLASAAVVRRLGFRYEGMLRRAGPQRGRMRDIWIAGRLDTDPPWPAADWPAETVGG